MRRVHRGAAAFPFQLPWDQAHIYIFYFYFDPFSPGQNAGAKPGLRILRARLRTAVAVPAVPEQPMRVPAEAPQWEIFHDRSFTRQTGELKQRPDQSRAEIPASSSSSASARTHFRAFTAAATVLRLLL